jgi:RNA polymerase sigma factor (sigma-70 family)
VSRLANLAALLVRSTRKPPGTAPQRYHAIRPESVNGVLGVPRVASVGNRDSPAGHSEYVGPEDSSDSELWQRVARHDGQAFGQLFDRHARAVYNHCFRRSAEWSIAEDLTSVVFLEAWRRRRDWQLSGDSILPWLLGIANNCLRNAERSRRRYRRLLARLPKVMDHPPADLEIEQRIEDEQAMRQILADLQQLRREEQEVIAFCDWDGLSTAEVSVALGIPVGTVKSRLSRARAQLREAQHTVLDASERTPAKPGEVTGE